MVSDAVMVSRLVVIPLLAVVITSHRMIMNSVISVTHALTYDITVRDRCKGVSRCICRQQIFYF